MNFCRKRRSPGGNQGFETSEKLQRADHAIEGLIGDAKRAITRARQHTCADGICYHCLKLQGCDVFAACLLALNAHPAVEVISTAADCVEEFSRSLRVVETRLLCCMATKGVALQ